MRTLKLWFNARWTYHRRCLMSWCWRGQTADYRCWKHWSNGDLVVDMSDVPELMEER